MEVSPCYFYALFTRLISYGQKKLSPAVGKFIEPVNGAYAGSIVDTRTSGTTSALKVIATKNFRMGGMFGYQFIDTVVATVVD